MGWFIGVDWSVEPVVGSADLGTDTAWLRAGPRGLHGCRGAIALAAHGLAMAVISVVWGWAMTGWRSGLLEGLRRESCARLGGRHCGVSGIPIARRRG